MRFVSWTTSRINHNFVVNYLLVVNPFDHVYSFYLVLKPVRSGKRYKPFGVCHDRYAGDIMDQGSPIAAMGSLRQKERATRNRSSSTAFVVLTPLQGVLYDIVLAINPSFKS